MTTVGIVFDVDCLTPYSNTNDSLAHVDDHTKFQNESKFVLMKRGALLNATLTKILNAVLSDEEK